MSVIDASSRFPGDRKRSRRRISRRFPKDVVDLLRIRAAKEEWAEEDVRTRFCPAIKRIFAAMISLRRSYARIAKET
jgi:hypothetical protein